MKGWVILIILFLANSCKSADLTSVFQQALENDAIYQQAILKAEVHREDIAINRAYLLPFAEFQAQPLVDRQTNSGVIVPDIQPAFNSLRSYDMRLSLTQPIFNMAIFSRYQTAKLSSKAALAKLNLALQDLILRVSNAYFNVLRSEKRVYYLKAYKKALNKELYDVKEKYKAGKTTQTDVYVVQSSYSAAESDFISAEDKLASDKEYLTQITSFEEQTLEDLPPKIPLISPQPANANQWVKKAMMGNWLMKANQLQLQAAKEIIKENYAAHLPTINGRLIYDNDSFHNTQNSLIVAAGSSRSQNAAAMLNFRLPIFAGGLTVASIRKAQYKFKLAQQQLEQSSRNISYKIRKNYRNVLSNIKKIHYQKDTIQAARASTNGLKERYQYGSGSLTDVLHQEAKLVEAQMQYESARYDYILSLLRLKKEAGTLSPEDLFVVNKWIRNSNRPKSNPKFFDKTYSK